MLCGPKCSLWKCWSCSRKRKEGGAWSLDRRARRSIPHSRWIGRNPPQNAGDESPPPCRPAQKTGRRARPSACQCKAGSEPPTAPPRLSPSGPPRRRVRYPHRPRPRGPAQRTLSADRRTRPGGPPAPPTPSRAPGPGAALPATRVCGTPPPEPACCPRPA